MASSKHSVPLFEMHPVRLADIVDIKAETETEKLLRSMDLEPDPVVATDRWDRGKAKWILFHYPMVLVKQRAKGRATYSHLGSGRALRIAQELLDDSDQAYAWVATRRVPRDIKIEILATDLLAMPAIFRTRPGLPKRLYDVWKLLGEKGSKLIRGSADANFFGATGFSAEGVRRTISRQPKQTE